MVPLYLTFGVTLIGFIAVNASRVVLQLYALELGANPAEVGFLVASFYICPLLFSWPAGTWGDRLGPRGPLLFSAVCGTVGPALPYFAHTLPVLYVAGALSGLSFAFFLVIVQNLVGVLSAPENRPQNFSNFSLVGAVSNFIGPLVAGFSIDQFRHPIACLVAAAFALATGAMLLIWGNLLPGGSVKPAPRTHILDTLADPAVVRILAIGSLVQVGTDLFQFYIPVYGVGIGLSASTIGALLAVFAAASFIVRFALPRLIKRLGEYKVLAYSFYLAALGFALVPLFHNVIALSLVSFIFGLGTGCGQPIATMLMFSLAADGRSGEALGLRLTVNNLVRVISPALFGLVVSGFGLAPVFFVNAAMMGAGGLLGRSKDGRAKL
jgi:MFS family permease